MNRIGEYQKILSDFVVIDITTAAGTEQIQLSNYEIRKKIEYFDGLSTQIFTSENGNVTSMPEKLGSYFKFELRTHEDTETRSKYHKLKHLTQERYTATFTLNYFTWSESGGLPTAPTTTTPAVDYVQQSVSIPCVFKINETPVDNTQRGQGTVREKVEITAHANTCSYTFPDATPEAFIGNDIQAGYFVKGACPNVLPFVLPDDGKKRFVIQAFSIDGNVMLNELGHVVRLTWYDTDTPATIYADITARIGTNLAAAATIGTDPATLAAGEIIDHLGDFDTVITGLQNYITSGVIAHGGEIVWASYLWMLANNWTDNSYKKISVKIRAEEDGKIGAESSVNIPFALRTGEYGNQTSCHEYGGKTFLGNASNSQVSIIDTIVNECGDSFTNVQEQTALAGGAGYGTAIDENEVVNGYPTFYHTRSSNGDRGIYMLQHNGGSNFIESGNWTATLVYQDGLTNTISVITDPLRTSNGRPWLWVTTNSNTVVWIFKWDGVSSWAKTDFSVAGFSMVSGTSRVLIDPANHDLYFATRNNPVNIWRLDFDGTVDGEDDPSNYTESALLAPGFSGTDGLASGGGNLGVSTSFLCFYKNAGTGEKQFLITDSDIDYLRAVTWTGSEYRIDLIAGSTTGNTDGPLVTAQFEELYFVSYDSINDRAIVSERTPNHNCRTIDFGLSLVSTTLQGNGNNTVSQKY